MKSGLFSCWSGFHTPRDDTARWNGLFYAGTCSRCGKSIRRLRKGWWIRDRSRR